MSTGPSVEEGIFMCPRPYRAGERRLAATHATRSKIVQAAREILSDPNVTSLRIDAVAERADVARMTVYYQFKSKGKLLEAVFDDVGARANMRDMRKVFQETAPEKALALLIEVFCHLWQTQGPLVRRLQALAALDPEVAAALAERGSWRREALTTILERPVNRKPHEGLVDLLQALTSLDTYDCVAHRRKPKEAVKLLQRAAAAIVTDLGT